MFKEVPLGAFIKGCLLVQRGWKMGLGGRWSPGHKGLQMPSWGSGFYSGTMGTLTQKAQDSAILTRSQVKLTLLVPGAHFGSTEHFPKHMLGNINFQKRDLTVR